ncbi:amidase [Candidatus Poriferisodalis sp.]|uniref:amidase n=1 Tax=Candidatus Poriferisodalis sp. TaxID=3101277 RepID=UPI003B0129A1
MTQTQPCDLSATRALELMGAGELSATELLESCLERVAAVDPAVNALIGRDDDAARATARRIDSVRVRGEPLGPLAGLPVAIKDIQATAGLMTTYGAVPFARHVPDADDGIVARVRGAGAVVIGKTNTPELSIGANTVNRLFGATGNPFDPSLTCGGSSGGSAVALACGMAPLATGSDHGGSLRIPASYCGVVAHRSTPGTVAHDERTIARTNYSVQGPMARTVGDAALLLSVVAGRDRSSRRDPMAFPLDAAAFASVPEVDVAALRVGVSADLGGLLVSDAVREVFGDRVERLAGMAGSVEQADVDLSDALEVDWQLRSDVFAVNYHRSIHQFDQQVDHQFDDDVHIPASGADGGFNPNIRATYDEALSTTVLDVAKARRRQIDLYRAADALFDTFDVLICPGVSVPPFDWHQLYPAEIDGRAVSNYMAWLGLSAALTVVGLPTTALPCGRDAQGTPFGLQLVGPSYSDRRLLGIAAALEAAFADDPVTARPVPDTAWLSSMRTACRSEGRLVHAAAPSSAPVPPVSR